MSLRNDIRVHVAYYQLVLPRYITSLPSSEPSLSVKPSLPPEIIIPQIVQEVAYIYYKGGRSVCCVTLRQLCLASKSFLHFSRSALLVIVVLE